jgi:hypothetical protein
MASRSSAAACSSTLYGLGLLGAWVYFWQQTDGFWGHVWGLLEGIFWPAFLVYHALGLVGA